MFLKEIRELIDSMEVDYTKFYNKNRVSSGIKLRAKMKEVSLKLKEFKTDTLHLEKELINGKAEKREIKNNSGENGIIK
jgi:hypothetical protein